MKFAEVIETLKLGGVAQRRGWMEHNELIVRQIPSVIAADVVPKMTSLPISSKEILKGMSSTGIAYHDQVIKITIPNNEIATATYYVPTWEDIFAEDWECAVHEEDVDNN